MAYKKREREQEIEASKVAKERHFAEKEWQQGTEERVGDWRDFMGSKNKKIKSDAMVKVPALKTESRSGALAQEHLDKTGVAYKKNWR